MLTTSEQYVTKIERLLADKQQPLGVLQNNNILKQTIVTYFHYQTMYHHIQQKHLPTPHPSTNHLITQCDLVCCQMNHWHLYN